MTEKTTISPPIQVGHPVHNRLTRAEYVVLAIHGEYAWVAHRAAPLDPPLTRRLDMLVTDLPDVEVVELEPAEMDAHIEKAKLAQVKHLVHVIAKTDPSALGEMLARLGQAYKGRILMPGDDATPEQMAQGLLTSVLMAAVSVEGSKKLAPSTPNKHPNAH